MMAGQDLKTQQNAMLEELDEDSERNKYLIFQTNDEFYGISVTYITEIIEIQKFTEVPDTPEYVRGLINLRGNVIPVIDIRILFRMERRDYDDRTCIIVMNLDGKDVGLIVDTVSEIVEILPDNIAPPPQFNRLDVKNRYIRGLGKVGKDVRIILDVNELLLQER